MADDPNVNDDTQQTPEADGQQQDAPKLAGKYESRDALNSGIGELADRLEMEVDYSDLDDQSAVKMYGALNRMFTRRNQDDDDDAGNADDGDDDGGADGDDDDVDLSVDPPEITDEDTINEVLEKTGLDAKDIGEQWQSEGALTDDQYTRIKEALPGVTRGMIDDFMKGQQVLHETADQQREQITSKAAEMVGGKRQLQTLLSWGRSLPKETRDDINRRLQDPNLYEGALYELQTRHTNAVGSGSAKPLVDGEGGGDTAAGLIQSGEEYRKTLAAARSGDEAAKQRLLNHRKAKNRIR